MSLKMSISLKQSRRCSEKGSESADEDIDADEAIITITIIIIGTGTLDQCQKQWRFNLLCHRKMQRVMISIGGTEIIGVDIMRITR
mmetsp:Transcript_5640/g.9462  ORF Transcript_5640/g.9462 Transcript_5640/m.9462 type:complete len:86 (+) Transcript_5640:410-667(+)